MQAELTKKERQVLGQLSTPKKIQDFLDSLPTNFEERGDTHRSPREVLRVRKAHCIEGACLAAAALAYHGAPPLLMDFTTRKDDEDHVVALFKAKGHWGAISTTNRAILGYRDPIYRTLRELALSYFHEYFMFEDGKKTLRSYSLPLNLSRFGWGWVTAKEDLWWLDDALDSRPHYPIVPKGVQLRPARPIERAAARLTLWKHTNPST